MEFVLTKGPGNALGKKWQRYCSMVITVSSHQITQTKESGYAIASSIVLIHLIMLIRVWNMLLNSSNISLHSNLIRRCNTPCIKMSIWNQQGIGKRTTATPTYLTKEIVMPCNIANRECEKTLPHRDHWRNYHFWGRFVWMQCVYLLRMCETQSKPTLQ